MEEKKENSKSRFLEFLNSIGISQYKCAQMCGWASGYLTGLKGDFGADKLATMMSIFPQLNIVWIINGKGEMFNSDISKNEEVKEASKHRKGEWRKSFSFLLIMNELCVVNGGKLRLFI